MKLRSLGAAAAVAKLECRLGKEDFLTLFTELSSRYQTSPAPRSAALCRVQEEADSHLSAAPLHRYVGRLFVA